MTSTVLLLPRNGLRRLMALNAGTSGAIKFKHSSADDLMLLSYVKVGEVGYQVPLAPKTHRLNQGDTGVNGLWFQVPVELHCWWYELVRRGDQFCVPRDEFVKRLPGPLTDPGALGYIVLTYARGAAFPPYDVTPIPEFAAWLVTRDGVSGVSVAVEPAEFGTGQLAARWPIDDLAKATVMVVGVGSIGGAAVTALAGYGVGRLLLVDPDRLMWHNLVRHVLPGRHVGHFKVDALREHLSDQRSDTRIVPYRFDVVDDAHEVRGLLSATDIVLCCADGVAPRRVVSHLARRAGKPAVLACVLDDGGIGEIIRLRPYPDHGCLLCRRQALIDDGTFDPEPELEAGYGTGTLHQPMTAVGSDLAIVGDLAAKVTTATVLETAGHYTHRLPGEQLNLALQARRGWPGPYDLGYTGNARWVSTVAPPRDDCPTCGKP
ncbi:ThiF family adenylyltransferase [Amycolatopsis sp. NPDC004169]|uniref:HesA/MoeB/ThiF family protein n=1 Tax=Amycolatopsis sp. NPDC004169 TaxID=3154453 RepID=UPI0033A38C44